MLDQPGKRVDQNTIEFDIPNPSLEDFDELYERPKPFNENLNARMDFSDSGEEVVDELENIPAYRRKRMDVSGVMNQDSGKKLSRFSLSPDDDGKTILRDNNSYLHDNVD